MKRRYHLHLPAVLYCMLVLLVGSAAMNSQNNLLFWIFGLMFSGLIVSGVVSGVMMLGIRIRRVDPEHVAVGEPLIVRYQIMNCNRLVPIFNIHIEELSVGESEERERRGVGIWELGFWTGRRRAATAGDQDVGDQIQNPKSKVRNPDAKVFSGWQNFMDKAGAWVMHVGPRETIHGEAIFWPRRRGEVNFSGIRVWTTFPFGLVKKSITIQQPQHTRVFPRLHQVRRGLLRSIDTPGPVGTRITQRPGGTDDYFGLREYRENESIRHIAWKRSAALAGVNGDQLVCIERSMPSPPRLRVVLDLSTPTQELRVDVKEEHSARELEERTISLAASIVQQANMLGFEIGLTIVGLEAADPPHFSVRRNFWHARKLLAALATIDLDALRHEPDFAILSDNERSGLVVIRPDRPKPISDRSDITYFTGRQLERLTTGPIGWDFGIAVHNAAASLASPKSSVQSPTTTLGAAA